MSSFYVKYMNYNIYYTNCYILLKEVIMIIIMNNYEVNFFLPLQSEFTSLRR